MLPSESSLPIARRATWRDTECLELVCGIANAGGGRLLLDADVDSRGAVKRRTSRLMKTIPGLIAQSLNLTCAVELVLDSGRFCLEVVIPPANDPISFRGIFFFYKDGENHILDDEALDRLMQRDMEADVKWEQRPVVQASLDDLNMGLVTRFTGAARDTDLTVDLDEASAIEQTLRHAGLMTGVGTPTNAGILLLHNRPHQYIPGATVRIGFFGSHGGTPIYEDEVFGSLIEQVHSTVELLFEKYLPEEEPAPHGTYRLGTAGGHGRPPRDAVHEAVLNALAHKNYDSGRPRAGERVHRPPLHRQRGPTAPHLDRGRAPRTPHIAAQQPQSRGGPALARHHRRLGQRGLAHPHELHGSRHARAHLRTTRRRDYGVLPHGFRQPFDRLDNARERHQRRARGPTRPARGAANGASPGDPAGHEPHAE